MEYDKNVTEYDNPAIVVSSYTDKVPVLSVLMLKNGIKVIKLDSTDISGKFLKGIPVGTIVNLTYNNSKPYIDFGIAARDAETRAGNLIWATRTVSEIMHNKLDNFEKRKSADEKCLTPLINAIADFSTDTDLDINLSVSLVGSVDKIKEEHKLLGQNFQNVKKELVRGAYMDFSDFDAAVDEFEEQFGFGISNINKAADVSNGSSGQSTLNAFM